MQGPLKFLFVIFSANTFAKDTLCFFEPSPELNRKRFFQAAGLQAVGYGGSLAGLGAAWYSDYSRSGFHSFDDAPEWLQMDKAGHVLTSWYLGRISSNMYAWSGADKKRSAWIGTWTGWGYLTAIEVLDGFSDGWGFSWSDVASNTAGAALFLSQRLSKGNSTLIRGVQGMSLKFSFHQTGYPQFRPALLGKNFGEQVLKDYNGQSYWLSFNLASFMKEEARFPKWLNLAFGYGAEGMISGREEFVVLEGGGTLWMERYRKYYFSLDVDLSRIRTGSHFLKGLAETFCFIKIPCPALEFSGRGVRAHALYY